ncbi:Na+/H+ antiporter NhaC [Staphylococcus sp. HMSC056G08]|uniref:Na+/H+ antiporter NhaC n=1 Tax=Staphylococcus sp. HMSC056G08 TaxID=1739350 RepID=UPI0008A10AB2|nr:Na+/H+ antiporter NhaC [Staphylococcus sp. HMSC056G08]OFJ73144.1 Na+/H+ antiporter NhaC [Staphylococcus sp. HMSC056G08]
MKRMPTLLESISTIVVMMLLVIVGFVVFGIPVQPLLILSAAYASVIAWRIGLRWKDLEEGITQRLSTAMPTIYIILCVGIVVGTWMYSGTVPALIYYGLKLLNPSYFLVSAFLISAITSMATGTAWGSASTAGIALIAIAHQLHIDAGMAAGAIIAGAVFGDKLSPLSDTTNLAAMVTNVNIFAHIKAMLWTTIPASIIGMIVWFFAGLNHKSSADKSQINALLRQLENVYHINFSVWIPAIVIIACLLFRFSTVPAMLVSCVAAIFVGALNHGFNFTDGFKAAFDGFKPDMIVHQVNLNDKATTLLEQGGMMSMTQVIVTIFCGYAFAGIVEKSGCLTVMLNTIKDKVTSPGILILVTVISGLIMVLAAGVASVVIIVVGMLLYDMYDEMKLSRTNLSRTLEDSGTMIIPLIPWGTSGIYYTQQLGVNVYSYFIWTVPCYLCVIFAIFYAFTGWSVKKVKSPDTTHYTQHG